MSPQARTSEEQLLAAIEVLKARGEPFDMAEANKAIEWEIEPSAHNSPNMERIMMAEMTNYVIYAAAAKQAAMIDMPPDTARISWSIYTLPEHEAATGAQADTMEQAMKFGEIAYRAIYGLEYKGDA